MTTAETKAWNAAIEEALNVFLCNGGMPNYRMKNAYGDIESLKKPLPSPEPEIILEMTSSACPEQYDAFCDGKQVGYLRLRGGWFRVDYPDCGEETIFETKEVRGDGAFNDDEREHWLAVAKEKIRERMKKESSAQPDWRELHVALIGVTCKEWEDRQRGRKNVVSFFKKLHEDILEEIGAALGSVAVHELHNRVAKLEAEKPCEHAAMTWHIEDIRRILNSVQSTLFTHIGPYPKKDAPVSEHSPHCGCGECKKLREAAKPRVPAENATLEEVAAACAKTGRAGESFKNEKPHEHDWRHKIHKPSEEIYRCRCGATKTETITEP